MPEALQHAEAERQAALAPPDQQGSSEAPRAAHEGRVPRAENPLLARWQADVRNLAAELRIEAGGWQRLRIHLDDDAGTITLRARREEDRVALNVAFSDPALRQTAQASAERLHAALETQLGQSIDFSFDDGGSRQPASDGRGHAPGTASSSPSSSRSAPRTDAPRPAPGSAREWIG